MLFNFWFSHLLTFKVVCHFQSGGHYPQSSPVSQQRPVLIDPLSVLPCAWSRSTNIVKCLPVITEEDVIRVKARVIPAP